MIVFDLFTASLDAVIDLAKQFIGRKHMKNNERVAVAEAVRSEERRVLGWRVATVFMVLGVPLIVSVSSVLAIQIQASRDVEIKRIELSNGR